MNALVKWWKRYRLQAQREHIRERRKVLRAEIQWKHEEMRLLDGRDAVLRNELGSL